MVAIRRLAPLLILALAPASSLSAVRHCVHPDGSLLFTQFDCPTHTVPRTPEPGGGGGLSIVAGASLTSGEQSQLAAVERSLAADRRARKQDRNRRAGERQRRQAEATKRCTEAVRALKGIEDSRRQGYTTIEERRFDREASRWQEIRRANC
jgi:hypothetical protein